MKISNKQYSCDGIVIPERAKKRGLGNNSNKLIVDDSEKFLKVIIVQKWDILRKLYLVISHRNIVLYNRSLCIFLN